MTSCSAPGARRTLRRTITPRRPRLRENPASARSIMTSLDPSEWPPMTSTCGRTAMRTSATLERRVTAFSVARSSPTTSGVHAAAPPAASVMMTGKAVVKTHIKLTRRLRTTTIGHLVSAAEQAGSRSDN